VGVERRAANPPIDPGTKPPSQPAPHHHHPHHPQPSKGPHPQRAPPPPHLDHGQVEPLPLEAVVLEARLVADPLLIHVLVQPRHDAHHLGPAAVHPDVCPQRVRHVDALGGLELPGARREGGGLGGERAHGAEVDDVAGELAGEQLLDVGADLAVAAAPRHAHVLHARHLGGEAHAAGAVDAARHHRLDQGAQVLVLHRALHLAEAAAVAAKHHRLVLQVALTALIADGAVQRVVDLARGVGGGGGWREWVWGGSRCRTDGWSCNGC